MWLQPCLEEPEAKFARVGALKMVDILHKRAGMVYTGERDGEREGGGERERERDGEREGGREGGEKFLSV